MAADTPAPAAGLVARASQVRFTDVLDSIASWPLIAIGWLIGFAWLSAVCVAMYVATPVAWGFRAGAHRPQPDERPVPEEPPVRP